MNKMASRSDRKSLRSSGTAPSSRQHNRHSKSDLPGTMRHKILAASLILATLSALVWFPALRFGFVYDDHLQIESNPQLQSFSGIAQALHEPLWAQLGPEK